MEAKMTENAIIKRARAVFSTLDEVIAAGLPPFMERADSNPEPLDREGQYLGWRIMNIKMGPDGKWEWAGEALPNTPWGVWDIDERPEYSEPGYWDPL